MPPVVRSEAEESNFLDDLFSQLDSGAPAVAVQSPPRRRVEPCPPPRTPVRFAKHAKSPRKTPLHTNANGTGHSREHALHVAQHVDLSMLVDGAEDWDWDDMNSDFMTPQKSSPVVPKV